MANPLKGEKEIELNGIKYNTVIDMDVIAEFESETNSCFMNISIGALLAMEKTRHIESPLERAYSMSNAVSLKNCAWLIYLAAKKGNSQVEFGEIQEAILEEGAIDYIDKDNDIEIISYPIIFCALVEFAITGNLKKKIEKT